MMNLFAVMAMEASGTFHYFAGSEGDCRKWKQLQKSVSWNQLMRREIAPDWVPPFVSEVLPKEDAEKRLAEGFGLGIELTLSPPFPDWRNYGFDLPTLGGHTPPPVAAFDSANPNRTGHSEAFLKASAGVGVAGEAGVLAEDWRNHPKGSLAIITPVLRKVIALYVQEN
ncbi:MAG: hypothetical protein V3S64_13325 [bacterium]